MEQKKKIRKPVKEIKKQAVENSSRSVHKWFYLVLVLLPVVFFIILELALRLFNYGYEIPQWVHATDEKLILNPDIARRYFYTTKNVPTSNQNAFDAVKKENAYRVFILGESSAAGYPYLPNGDFGKYIKHRLELTYPGKTIEVINLGITAITSYTIRDLFNGIIEQKPDLVLIYTGHNEYYGALGVGSLETLGSNPAIVNASLYLNKFRTFQLLRSILRSVAGIFETGNEKAKGGTLMARMAKDKLITYNSDEFKSGLKQYETNMDAILESAHENNIPVILGTLTCNLKDQPPFISIRSKGLPPAKEVFNNAVQAFNSGNHNLADSLFRYAKDLDALRFRAPEELNRITQRLAVKFGFSVAEVDEGFNKVSPGMITGSSIMVDHLHPTLDGYRVMGRIFYEAMEKAGCLPTGRSNIFPAAKADSLTVLNCYYSALDSAISKYRILILKNDWPFSEPKSVEYMVRLFNPVNKIDSLALLVVDSKLSWESAHREAAKFYFNTGNYGLYTYEMGVLIDQFPFITEYYSEGSQYLLKAKQFDYAYSLLYKGYLYKPTAFITKWLGIIDLSRNNAVSAAKYLKKSSEMDSSDPQVFYNLAGAYSFTRNYTQALDAINRCLALNPEFPQARGLKMQLQNLK